MSALLRPSLIDWTQFVNHNVQIAAILVDFEEATTSKGAKYYKLHLMDKHVKFTANLWDVYLTTTPQLKARVGTLTAYDLAISLYGTNKVLSYSVKQLDLCDADTFYIRYGFKVEDFIDVVENRDELAAKLSKHLDSISYSYYGKIARRAVENNWEIFKHVAAGSALHHSSIGGLLQHTVEVTELAIDMYNSAVKLGYTNLCKELIIAGTIVHDIGKCIELNTLSTGGSTYTPASYLARHSLLGVQIITEAATQLNLQNTQELLELCHIIAAHHDQAEWGQLVDHALVESTFISKADYLSSILNATQRQLSTTHFGEIYQAFGASRNWLVPMGAVHNEKQI